MRKTIGLLFALAACAPPDDEARLAPDEAPGLAAAPAAVEVVAPGVVSTDLNQTFPAIDPLTGDLWYSEYEGSFDDQTIRRAPVSGNSWSSPVVAPFSGRWGDRAPRFTPDGATLYFTSNRPLPDTESGGDMNLWVVERTPDGWSDPVPATALNSGAADIHASASAAAVWFASAREGGFGRSDLYRAAEGRVTHLGPELNDELSQPDLWISEDESWMILAITDHPDGLGGDDLYLSRNLEGTWSTPANLGAPINSGEYEYGPWVDAEFRYLYFTSHRDGSSHIYRIPVAAIGRAVDD